MIESHVEQAAIEHAMQEMEATGRESCGLVIEEDGQQVYVACRNIATEDDGTLAKGAFIMHHVDYANACDRGDVVAVVHSHVYGPPEPSETDLIVMARDDVPWLIVSVPNGTAKLHPVPTLPISLLGRPYSFGASDCFSLVRDYYRTVHGIDMPDFPRTDGFDARGEDLFMNHYRQAGFVEVHGEPQPGDGLLMQCTGSPVINHCAVYLGDNLILQHCRMRPSSKDVYGSYWRKRTKHILRHRGLT